MPNVCVDMSINVCVNVCLISSIVGDIAMLSHGVSLIPDIIDDIDTDS